VASDDDCGMSLGIFNEILWSVNAPEQRFWRNPMGRGKIFVSWLCVVGSVFRQFVSSLYVAHTR
jgi:hypothetical protein